jgi:hypothetical protein
MTDAFNHPLFNTPGDLFGSDVRRMPSRRPLTELPQPPKDQTVPRRPTTRSEVNPPVLGQDTAIPPIKLVMLEGPVSAGRAVRTADKIENDFWKVTTPVVIAQSGVSDVDPTADEINTGYSDLLLNSYLPPALQPTADDYAKAARPSQREAYVTRELTLRVQTPAVPAAAQTQTEAVLLPTNPPFANSLRTFCSDRIFTGVVQGRGGLSALQ